MFNCIGSIKVLFPSTSEVIAEFVKMNDVCIFELIDYYKIEEILALPLTIFVLLKSNNKCEISIKGSLWAIPFEPFCYCLSGIFFFNRSTRYRKYSILFVYNFENLETCTHADGLSFATSK